jgi:hypothetical protein
MHLGLRDNLYLGMCSLSEAPKGHIFLREETGTLLFKNETSS